MPSSALAERPPAWTSARPLRRLTVDEYHAMGRAGVFAPDERVELLDGYLYAMSPIGIRHAACVRRLTRLFASAVGPRAIIDVQNPLRLSNHAEPEPDVTLLVPKDAYDVRLPRPDDVRLLVEVSDTTLPFDRDVKLPLYAREGVREVWIVALEEDRVYAYRKPTSEGYGERRTLGRGDELGVEALPDVRPFAVEEVLGP